MIKKFEVSEIDCAVCAGKIEDAIKKIEGVKNVNLNFIMQTLTVEADEADFNSLINKIIKAGRKIERNFSISEV
ncbi:MAG: heavy-metal-associated domain-containing protein [Ruminococcaceae bacterium]|nr:heavy-metal-associated domain-containing protein [Oscillospiraceae bacterium]